MKKYLTGFTLMELIIVIVILGILASIGIPMYRNVVEKENGNVCMINIRMIIASEKIYKMRNGHYWPNDGDWHNITVQEIKTNLNIRISDSSFNYRICNAYFTDKSNPIHLYGIRNSGTYELMKIYYRLWPIDNTTLWAGNWFIGEPPDPPSFPLPEE